MKKILSIILISISINTFIACNNQKQSQVSQEEKKIKFEFLEQKEVKQIKRKDLYLEYEYEIKSVEAIDEILFVQVEAKTDSKEAMYALGEFISEYIKLENKAKLDLYGTQKIKILFNEEWLYDQTNILNRIKT